MDNFWWPTLVEAKDGNWRVRDSVPTELTKNSDGSTTIINLTVRDDGAFVKREPDMNAVIVQMIEAPQDDGTMEYRRVVSIMCKDDSMRDVLTAEARNVLWALERGR